MNTRKVICLILFSITLSLFADDTVIAGTGENIHAKKTSDISMANEVLNIVYSSSKWDVSVDYIFINPSEERVEKVAFVSINKSKKPNLLDSTNKLVNFTTNANGIELPFEHKINGDDDYYEYTMVFRKGENRIKHSYSIKGTEIWDPYSKAISYKLTTGNNWSGPIGNLEINVTFSQPVILLAYNSFFSLSGKSKSGQLTDGLKRYDYTFVPHGGSVFKARNYSPGEDIYIKLDDSGVKIRKDVVTASPLFTIESLWFSDISKRAADLKLMTCEQITFLRDSILAKTGKSFDDPQRNKFFDQFGWYFPDGGEGFALTPLQQKNLAYLEKILIQ